MGKTGPTPEATIALLALVAIGAVLLWRAFRWFFSGPTTPNPWGPEVEEQIERPDAVPICTRCLEPQQPDAYFCPECGAPVSALVNFNPYLYVFSVGDLLRVGSFGGFRRGWLALTGFVIVSLAEYMIFAPIYWFFLGRNVGRQRHATEEAPPISAAAG
jgi:hypothetical protein